MNHVATLENGRLISLHTGEIINDLDIQVLKGYAEGRSTVSMSKELYRSPRTIENRATIIKRKLGAKTLPNAVFIAQKLNII